MNYISCVLLGWLNLILKEWLTISRGAEPSAQNPNSKTEKYITRNDNKKGNDDKTLLNKKSVRSAC